MAVGITVKEALELPAFHKAVLLAGASGLHRVITSVNIMEVPEIWRWAKENELLVTTTYPIKDNPGAQATLITELDRRGLAALAIKPVFYGNTVPEMMIAQAESLSFPLIQLPTDASFNDYLNPVLAEILNRQAARLRRSEQVHRSLSNIVLKGGSLNEIAETLGGILQAPVSIHSSRLRLLALWEPAGTEGRRVGTLSRETARLLELLNGGKGRGSLDRFTVWLHPVTVARENYAFIAVWRQHADDRRPEVSVLEQAATVVALEIAKLRAVAEVEGRFRSALIEDLIQGRIESRADALARGEQFGWDLSASFVPLLLQIEQMPASARELAQALRRLREAVALATFQYAPGSPAVDLYSRILVLTRGGRASEVANRTKDEMASWSFTVSAGVGRQVTDILQLNHGYQQALHALEVGAQVSGPGAVTRFDDLGVYRLLAGRPNAELQQFARDLLAGLLEADTQASSNLVSTLEAVLAAGGNLRQAARAVFVHYNTVRYRVSRIEEITGVDLKAAEGRLNLQVALKILKMRN